MLLYHGTSQAALTGILTDGIRPRGKSGKSNWTHSIESNPNCVYLTEGYGLHFAINAADQCKATTAVLVEVDTNRLNLMNLLPDEDAVEQISRGHDDLSPAWDMKKRTRYYRKKMIEYAGNWTISIKAMGTACHLGTIPVHAITRFAKLDLTAANTQALRYASDPTISIANYRIMAGYYRQLTRRVFGDKIDADDLNFPDYEMRLNALPRDGVTVEINTKELVL